MKVLITGAGGFVGRHLVSFLLSMGDQVIAACHPPESESRVYAGAEQIALDVTDSAAVETALAEHEVDAVIHLAAITFVPEAEASPGKTMAVNLGGTANVLRALANHRPRARFLLVSSAEVYGQAETKWLPLTESAPLQPANVYALSKLQAEQLVFWAEQRYSLDVLVARPFAHIGPGQSPNFSVSGFAAQLAAIAAGKSEPVMRVGNLAVGRDMLDVRDVVIAYRLILRHGSPGGIYNVCSGKEYRLEWIVQQLIEFTGKKITIQVDPDRLRARDVLSLYGAAEKLRQETSWRPQIPIRQTLSDIFLDWQNRLSA